MRVKIGPRVSFPYWDSDIGLAIWWNDVAHWWNHKFMPHACRIRVDPWDTWNADYTITSIVVPVLEQLKRVNHGYPMVDREDVPVELRNIEPDMDQQGAPHPLKEKQWEWVQKEIIWALGEIARGNNEDAFRIQRGCELFGKYFQSLWD